MERFEIDAGAILGHLSEEQRQHVRVLDAAFVDLLGHSAMDLARVEMLADAVVALYDEIEGGRA